jgi:hypothetical protein
MLDELSNEQLVRWTPTDEQHGRGALAHHAVDTTQTFVRLAQLATWAGQTPGTTDRSAAERWGWSRLLRTVLRLGPRA